METWYRKGEGSLEDEASGRAMEEAQVMEMQGGLGDRTELRKGLSDPS